eukprot:4713653-Alexandrium_andersonii.AAC.1
MRSAVSSWRIRQPTHQDCACARSAGLPCKPDPFWRSPPLPEPRSSTRHGNVSEPYATRQLRAPKALGISSENNRSEC